MLTILRISTQYLAHDESMDEDQEMFGRTLCFKIGRQFSGLDSALNQLLPET